VTDNPGNLFDLLTDGPPDAHWTLLLAHGAGQGMASPFMAQIAGALGRAGTRVIPPGKPDRLRIEHLRGLRTPTLICQGTRDPFGTPDEVAGYALAPSIRLAWIEDGDHSFKPRRLSGRSWEQNLDQATEAVLGLVASL
jgi:predicted alpha/beta-hydrolase family hydrolase